MATVHQLNSKPVKAPAQSRRSQKADKALRRQGATAVGIGAVAVTLTALSLSHLAHGVEVVAGSSTYEAWAVAVGIDLGFIALELRNSPSATGCASRRAGSPGRRSLERSSAAPA